MPTPKKGYFLADGTQVPGTTTVLGRFKESGPLIRWAWSEGKAGRELYEKRDQAADIGTAAHAMVEARIRGLDPEACEELAGLDDEGKAKARNAFEIYEEWASMSRLDIVDQEMQLVSEKYRFGGTPELSAGFAASCAWWIGKPATVFTPTTYCNSRHTGCCGRRTIRTGC